MNVGLCYQPGQLVVEVVDDGRRPTDPAGTGDAGSGHGIIGMRERATAVGGTLQAGARQEGGFAVRACLPLQPAR